MSTKHLAPVLLLASLVLLPQAATAQVTSTPTPTGFGTQRQWVVSGDFRLRFMAGGNNNEVELNPSVDTFIAPHVSVGGHLRLWDSGDNTDFGVGARAGYALDISSLVTLWARGGLIYTHGSRGMDASFTVVDLEVSAPFLFHVAPHFFVGLGPVLNVQVKGNRDTLFGIESIVGGYFDL